MNIVYRLICKVCGNNSYVNMNELNNCFCSCCENKDLSLFFKIETIEEF